MGASFNTMTFDLSKMTISEAKEQWNQEVEESLFEDGHSYSGGIGMLGSGFSIVNSEARDTSEADDWICDHHNKWDGAMAMRTQDKQLVVGGWCSE